MSTPSGKDRIDARVLRIGDGAGGRDAAGHGDPEAQRFGLLDDLGIEGLEVGQVGVGGVGVKERPGDGDDCAVEAGGLHGLQPGDTALHIEADLVTVGAHQALTNIAVGPDERYGVMRRGGDDRQGRKGLLNGGIGGVELGLEGRIGPRGGPGDGRMVLGEGDEDETEDKHCDEAAPEVCSMKMNHFAPPWEVHGSCKTWQRTCRRTPPLEVQQRMSDRRRAGRRRGCGVSWFGNPIIRDE